MGVGYAYALALFSAVRQVQTRTVVRANEAVVKIYLASNYSTHPQMREYARELETKGHTVTSEWINGTHDADAQAEYAQIDIRDLEAAEAIIFFSDAPVGSRTRGGKHVEFGYAMAKGKRIFIVGKCQNVFHHLPEVIQRMEWTDLLNILLQSANGRPGLNFTEPSEERQQQKKEDH